MRTRIPPAGLMAGLLLTLSLQAPGQDWMQWRGPALNGTSGAVDLPVSWSVEDGQNIAWVTRLAGSGNATPVVAGDRIFLTMTTGEAHQLQAVCIHRQTGKVEWTRTLGASARSARDNAMASPSAVTDGHHVWFMFGQGTLAAFTLEGKALWQRELEQDYDVFTQKYGYSSSPLLYNDTLYITVLRRLTVVPPLVSNGSSLASLLIAIDPLSGKIRWVHERLTPAEEESKDAYNTPVVYTDARQAAIVVTGGDLVTGHDPATGKELWRYDWAAERRISNWRLIAGPVIADDLIIAPLPRGGRMVAVRPRTGGAGMERVWEYDGYAPDVCTPAYHDGLLYVLDGKKRYLTAMDAATGAIIWQKKLESRAGFYASPTVADGRIYILDLAGEVSVFAAGHQARQLAQFSIGEERCPASIVAAGSDLILRTPTRLIGVRKKSE